MDELSFVRRVGVLGDIHGDSKRLGAALEFLHARHDLDALLCTGDVVNLEGYDIEGCCRLLQRAGVLTVRGNHDRWFLQNLSSYVIDDEGPKYVSLRSGAFIASLPPSRLYDSPAGKVLLCHGLGDNDMTGVYPDDNDARLGSNMALYHLESTGIARWIVNGHTHRRMLRPLGSFTIINAGTVCKDRTSGFCILDFDLKQAQHFDIDESMSVSIGEQLDLI